MNYRVIIILLLSIVSCKKENKELFVLDNLLVSKNIPVIIKRSDFKQIKQNKVPVFYFLDKVIPAQLDDLDGDGVWDEIALVIDNKQQGNLALSLKWEDKLPNFPKQTNIRIGVSKQKNYHFKDVNYTVKPNNHQKENPPRLYQMEGPAWENENVAFRTYFDNRNGKDIFGKRTTNMVLDSVGLKGANYHKLSNWGMDILRVGNSLGAGEIGFKYKDSLYRIDNTVKKSVKIVTEGAVRSILEFRYEGFQFADITIDVVEKITIWAGSYGYQSDVSYSGTNKSLQLITGFANFYKQEISQNKVEDYSYFASHGIQSEHKDVLGMAIITQTDNLVSVEKMANDNKKITDTNYGILKFNTQKSTRFWFVSGWEKSNLKFKEKEFFFNTIQNEVTNFNKN